MTVGNSSSGPWFVSYNGADREAARALTEFLEAHGIRTFFDRHSLIAGAPWFDELERALNAAPGALVLIGANGLGRIQKLELNFALKRQADAEAIPGGAPYRVIPVLLSRHSSEQLPGFAALNTWIEVADPRRPTELLQALDGTQSTSGTTSRRSPLCPFRALNSFREEDAPLYFGRRAATAALRTLVDRQTFVAVVGPSGSGKSSLVQAGLLPLLRAERPPAPTWETVSFNPGKRPFYNAASALASLWLSEQADVATRVSTAEKIEQELLADRSHLGSYVHEALRKMPNASSRLLIIVDQFEEIFTYKDDEALQRRFVESLFSCVDEEACQIVITIRADYYGRAIELGTRMTAVLQKAQLSVGPMETEELKDVILGPSSRAGLEIEPGLVERILTDMARQPGSLPLLEFTLTELWSRSPDGRLTHADYDAIGGVAGAIGTRADGVLAALGDTHFENARQVLTRLVRVASSSEEGSNTRQVLALDGLLPDSRKVIEEFARARLVVIGREDDGGATAEVAHEALIRTWTRLKKWIEDDFQFLVWRQRLDLFVSEWERLNHDASSLLSGSRLTEARQWQRSKARSFNEREQAFLNASARHEAGSRVWRWTAAAVFVLAAAAGGGYYWWIHTDAYIVRMAIRDAPVHDAAFAGRSDEDSYIEIIQDWIAALVTSRHDRAAAAAALDLSSVLNHCAEGTDAAHRRQRDRPGESEILPELRRILEYADGDAVYCASRLPLTDEEKALVLRAAREHRDKRPADVKQDDYGWLRETILAAQAASRLGGHDAGREFATFALRNVLGSSTRARGQLLASMATRLEPLLSEDEKRQLLSAVDKEEEYYARSAHSAMRAAHVTVDRLDDFFKELAEERRRQAPPDLVPSDVLFDPDVASAAANILAREIGKGNIDPAIAALDRLLVRLEKNEYAGRVILSLVLPPADALAAAHRTGEAMRLADVGSTRLGTIDNEDQRSRATAGLARVYGRCGRLAEAKGLADRAIRSLDRLAAYTAIVTSCPQCSEGAADAVDLSKR